MQRVTVRKDKNEAINATAFNGDNSAYADDYLSGDSVPARPVGRGIMPAYSEEQLSDTELWQVITYLRSSANEVSSHRFVTPIGVLVALVSGGWVTSLMRHRACH